jgi:alpha-1,2-mannosyltransferase
VSMRAFRMRAVGTVAALAAAAFVFDLFFAVRHGFFDLNVYYGAINYWADGNDIYNFVRDRSTYGFTYPPFAALTMLPMALVSWPVAVVIGAILTIVATVWLMRTLLAPMIERHRLTPWFTLAIALCLLAVYEPFRETFLFGQVNMLLLALVAFDLLFLVARRSHWAGVAIGLATAIKLTPGIFLIYLLVTKRWRAAIVAGATAAGATLFAAAVAPDASREFWTSALWDTERVGALSFVSNQSLQGVAARLDPTHPSKLLWLVLAAGLVTLWIVRVRRLQTAPRARDEVLGLALTGIVGVLLSPVTWIHHLVWAIPAFVLIVERGGTGRRVFAGVAFAILCSRVVWLYTEDFGGFDGFLLSNTYVWVMLALLVVTPGLPAQQAEPDVRGGEVAATRRVGRPRSVRV